MKTLSTSGSSSPHPAEAWLAIWGMYCPKCQARVSDALQHLPGVLEVEVDWVYMSARVVYAPDEVAVAELVECVGRMETDVDYQFWAAAGPDVTRAVRLSWELRRLH